MLAVYFDWEGFRGSTTLRRGVPFLLPLDFFWLLLSNGPFVPRDVPASSVFGSSEVFFVDSLAFPGVPLLARKWWDRVAQFIRCKYLTDASFFSESLSESES